MKPCTVEYTVTITNDGAADYAIDPQAAVSDDMADVLDDATYNADAVAVASDGSALPAPSVVAPTLSWAGPVAVGESVTITYSVTVTNLGDHDLVNVATPLCGDGVECEPPTTVEIELPSITPAKASDPATGAELVAGDVVTYTLSFTNDGQVAGPVDATDDLSGVLDDASITSEPIVDAAHAAAITADLDLAAETIRVTGELAPGETTTVTYQVTILADGERGDNVAGNVLTPDVPPYECAADDPDCDPFVPPTTEHLIGELDDWKTVDPASGATVKPGQVVTFTLHGHCERRWRARRRPVGQLPGRRRGEPPAECAPSDDERPDCTMNYVSNVVASKSSDPASGTAVAQGERVTYTLTFENVSTNPGAADAEIDYTDHMADVLDDATLIDGPSSSSDTVTAAVEGDTIRVTGAVASGDTVTVTYMVAVMAYDQQDDHRLGNILAVGGEEPICAPNSDLCTFHELTPPPPLAATGGTPAWAAAFGALALLILGGGAIFINRRRRLMLDAEEHTPVM